MAGVLSCRARSRRLCAVFLRSHVAPRNYSNRHGDEAPPTFTIVDGSYLLSTAFHLRPEPREGTQMFLRELLQLHKRLRADFFAVAFDSETGSSWRQEFLPDCRGTSLDLAEFQPMVRKVREACTLFGLAHFSREHYEAADVVDALIHQFSDCRVTVVSNRDRMAQLVNARVHLASLEEQSAPLDAAAVKQKFGVGPRRMRALLSLAGTKHIQGIRGIGPKIAAKLLSNYSSLEEILLAAEGSDRLEGAGPSAKQKLRDHADDVRMAHKLFGVRHPPDMPETQELRWREVDCVPASVWCAKSGFYGLMDAVAKSGPMLELPLQARGVKVVSELDAVPQALAQLRAASGVFAVSCEFGHNDSLRSFAVYGGEEQDFDGASCLWVDTSDVAMLSAFKEFFEDGPLFFHKGNEKLEEEGVEICWASQIDDVRSRAGTRRLMPLASINRSNKLIIRAFDTGRWMMLPFSSRL